MKLGSKGAFDIGFISLAGTVLLVQGFGVKAAVLVIAGCVPSVKMPCG